MDDINPSNFPVILLKLRFSALQIHSKAFAFWRKIYWIYIHRWKHLDHKNTVRVSFPNGKFLYVPIVNIKTQNQFQFECV